MSACKHGIRRTLPILMTVVMQAAFLLAGPRHAWAESGKADYVGAETCLGCHADKQSFKNNLHAKTIPNAKGIPFEKTCETCHGPGSLHAAAGGDKNNPDFNTIHNPLKLKAEEASGICLECHSGGKRMHWTGSMHEMKNLACVACHSVHNEKANEGKSPLLKKTSQLETCFQCHPEKKAQIRKSAHMPLLEGKMSCTSCHNPHGSTTDRLLVKSSVVETCYQCHQDERGPFLHDHPPVRENCLTCHNPHGSHNQKMLVTKPPSLCQRCHNVVGGHPGSDYEQQIAANVNSPKLINRGCVNCHSRIHGSNHPSGKYFTR